ncbi:MAG: hypothetical protein ACP5NV_02780 [Candidatus Woesearchaeota archaeon]
MSSNKIDLQLKNEKIDILLKKSKEELVQIILGMEDYSVPINVLSAGLHPLQAIVKYLHEEKKLKIRHISILLNRNVQTIWTSYRQVKSKKIPSKNSRKKISNQNQISIPLSILSKNNNSILESTVHYLNSVHKMPQAQIAKLLGKSIKTIWTCNNRYIIKGGKK